MQSQLSSSAQFFPYNDETVYPEGFPTFGRWIPKEQFVENWSATCFLQNFIDQDIDKELAAHASSLRNAAMSTVDLCAFNAGSTHVLMKVRFDDGVVWLARFRFPRCNRKDHTCVGGFRSFQSALMTMQSEIATMDLVRKTTTIPVPTVYGHDLSANNRFGAPYMLIEQMPGESIEERIIRDGGIYDYQIEKVENQIHRYMAELSKIRFNQIGRLGSNNQIISFPQLDSSLFDTPETYYTAKVRTTLSDNALCPVEESSIPSLTGAWDTASESEKIEAAMWIHLQVARFIGTQCSQCLFPLEHPDWNDQNVLVDEDYCVVGVIDWENARSCAIESFKMSTKLFRHNVKELDSRIIAANSKEVQLEELDIVRTVNPRLRELIQLFELPYFPRQFMNQTPRLVEVLWKGFAREVKQMLPERVTSYLRKLFKEGEICDEFIV